MGMAHDTRDIVNAVGGMTFGLCKCAFGLTLGIGCMPRVSPTTEPSAGQPERLAGFF